LQAKDLVDFPNKVPYSVKAFDLIALVHTLLSNINTKEREEQKKEKSKTIFFAFLTRP
jgi:hypothetical protein